MSSSVASASGVTYTVSFVPATPATNIGGIVIDFCTDTPIIGNSTCTTPSGMTVGGSISNLTGVGALGTVTANNSSRNDIVDSNSTPATVSSATTTSSNITSNSQTTFTVTSSAAYPAASSTNPASWFYITISTETMQVTNVSGSTWTVVRGALGSTALSSISSGATISQPPIAFTITGNTNPSVTGSLYARIYTFTTASAATTFAAGSYSSGSYSTASASIIDAGGDALYITSSISITAKVQEYLQFCIYTAQGTSGTSPNSPCSQTGSSVTLGQNSQGVLSTSNPSVDSSTRFDVATNATGYAAITFTGTPLRLGATSNYIEASSVSGTGSTGNTAYASSAGTNQFGLCVAAATGTYAASGYSSTDLQLTSLPNGNNTYNNASCPTTWAQYQTSTSASYGFNITQLATTYGDLLAMQHPGTGSTGIISFLANVSPTQVAGIYTTSLNFVASGTY
jgi:hypothetical protein